MAFAEGQQVRIKQGQALGTIARKLAFFEDMYVVNMPAGHTPARKLAHESELELLVGEHQIRMPERPMAPIPGEWLRA